MQHTLREFGLPDEQLADRLSLVASELVTNAVLHARTDLELRLSRQPGEVCLEVSDGQALRSYPSQSAPLGTGGRGLVLVDALVDAWGMAGAEEGLGKRVWARVSLV